MNNNLASFTDILADEICDSQPLSLSSSIGSSSSRMPVNEGIVTTAKPKERISKGTGQNGQFRCTEEIDPKYRNIFTYPYFNLVQSNVIEDALYSDKSIVVCAPTGSGKTVVFEMAIVQLLMELEEKQYTEDFKIIYMAPVKALCTERLTEWYSKFTKLGLLCIEVTGDTDVDFTQLKPYKIIITTPEKWDMLTRRWRDHRGLVEVIKLFLIDEVHILNDEVRGPVLEAVVSRMKTIESSVQSVHRIEQLQKEIQGETVVNKPAPRIRFVAVSATVSNPEDVAAWLGTSDKPAVYYKFGDECRPVKLRRVVEGYPCPEGTSIFKFDIILNYKIWPIIQKYHSGKPTLIFCNTRKSVILTAETLSREITISFNAEQKAKLTALAATIKNKKLQALVMSGVGCHHAGLLYEERQNIEFAFRNRDLPILTTTTTLAMGVNLPAHLVIIKNTQQYVNGAYQEYSISTVLQMVGRAGRPQFDTEATAVIMTRLVDKPRYQALVGGCEPLQSYLHKRLPENLNSEAALGTVGDVAQCVQWLRSTFLYVRAARDPKKYLGLPQNSPQHLISKKIEELCVKAMNGLASSGLITMDEASCIASTEAGRLMSIFYLDLETMKHIMKIEGNESLERLLGLICESHELADMHLRVDERRCLNTLNRNNAAATIRFPMKGKINTRQMKLNCIIQAVLGCLPIPDPSLNQEAMKIMRIADRVCKCLVTYVTRPDLISTQPQFYSAVLNSIILAKCISAHLWENSPFVSKQLKGIGPTFSTLLASAGKVNFMLLEESHPRDLERIMNKGAPAGNILRKQISLLPKYQITIIPVDENTVTVQLVLLNQSFLAENIENLTAGDTHKSYIIVGDSNNNLLLLAICKDKDLISVFDGTITHQVQRKHNFEHKIFAHCISSTFVGIDVQAEYLFNDLEQFFERSCATNNHLDTSKRITERQTCITDTFKERKRKNTTPDKTQSKEKKKRENAIIQNFINLKESFEVASNNSKQRLYNKQTEDFINSKTNTSDIRDNKISITNLVETNARKSDHIMVLSNKGTNDEIDSDDCMDDEKIMNLLNEIENEMDKNKRITSTKDSIKDNFPIQQYNPFSSKYQSNTGSTRKLSALTKRKATTHKSNYNFIDLLERKLSLSDEDDIAKETVSKENGFSEAIKNQIQTYISKAHNKVHVPQKDVEMLLQDPENSIDLPSIHINNKLTDKSTTYPRYEIKEILGDKTVKDTKENFKCNKNLINYDTDSNKYRLEGMKNIINRTDTVTTDNEDKSNNNEKYEKENKTSKLRPDQESYGVPNIDLCITDKYQKNVLNEQMAPQIFKRNKIDKLNEEDKIKDSAQQEENIYLTIDTDNLNNYKLRIHEEDTLKGDFNTRNIDTKDLMPVCNTRATYSIEIPKEEKSIETNNTKNKCLDIVPRSSDALITRNIINRDPTPTHTINMEKIRHYPNLNYISHPNNASDCECTTTSISIPSTHMKKDESVASNILKNRENLNRSYLKRYSYSASKIDVCTKENPDYNIKIIKKIKLDLDVTAIMTRKPNYFNDNKKSDIKENVTEEMECTNIIKPIAANSNPAKFLMNVNYNSSCLPKESTNTKSTSNSTQENNILEENKHEIIPVKYKEEISKDDNHRSREKRHEILPVDHSSENNPCSETKTPTSISISYNGTHKNESLNNISAEKENGFDDEQINDEYRQKKSTSLINGDNKIKNILYKYSKILSKTPATTSTPYISDINKSGTSDVKPSIKSKKPFRISDIHKLHATIPKTIVDNEPRQDTEMEIDASKQQHVQTLSYSKINNGIDTEKELIGLDSTPYIQSGNVELLEPIRESLLMQQSTSNMEIAMSPSPENIDLEPCKDVTIDQSMFDPKTLLKFVVNDNDNEIVPPPPEFCDDPVFKNEETSVADHYSQNFTQSIEERENTELHATIFDDPSAAELTPSKEIETWSLSREDSWQSFNSINSPEKSFTVMRRNIDDCGYSQNSTMSRKLVLGKFKYSQKNKYTKCKRL